MLGKQVSIRNLSGNGNRVSLHGYGDAEIIEPGFARTVPLDDYVVRPLALRVFDGAHERTDEWRITVERKATGSEEWELVETETFG